MVKQDLILSMSEPTNRTIYAKKGDSGRLYDIFIADAEKENGTLRILQPDGSEVTAPAIIQAGGDAYKGDLVTFSALEEVPLTKAEVTLESSQDLHGQSSPYPSGGGKNKFDIDSATMYTRYFSSTNLWQKAGDSASFAFYCQQNTQYTISCNNSSLTIFRAGCINVEPSTLADSNSPQIYEVTRKSSSGSITLTTTNDAVAIVVQLTQAYAYDSYLQIELGATATTYAPYSNICPIVGEDEVTVSQAGSSFHRIIPTTEPSVGALVGSSNGVSLYYLGGGKYKWKGTATSASSIVVSFDEYTTLPTTVTTRLLRFNNTQTQSNASVEFRKGTTVADSFAMTAIGRQVIYVTLANKAINNVVFRVVSGYSVDMEIMPEFVDTAEESTYTEVFPTTSKNLFLGEFLQGYWAYANGTWTDSNTWIATPKVRCKPSTYYTASADAKMTRWQGFVWYDENGDYISTDNSQSNANIGLTKQSPSNAKFLVFNIGGYPNSSSTISVEDVTHFQIEEGQTATAYEPHKYAVYGGTLDLVSGKLTVTHGIQDLGSLSWGIGASDTTNVYSMSTSELNTVIKKPSSSSVVADVICESYPTINADSVYTKHLGIAVTASGDVRVYDSNYNTNGSQTSFKTAMNGVNLVYELATPIEYDLTPTQISTLLGENNIWSSGEVEVAFEYDGLFAQLPEEATEQVGKCIGDVAFTGASSMPFILHILDDVQEETP